MSTKSGGKAAWEALPAGWCYVPRLGMFVVPSAASSRAAYLGPSTMRFGRTHCSARICNGHPEKVQLKHFGHPPSHLPHSNFGFWALFATSASQVLRRGRHHFGCERPHQPIAAYGPAARIQLLRSHAGGAAGDVYLWLQAPLTQDFPMGLLRQQMWEDISW